MYQVYVNGVEEVDAFQVEFDDPKIDFSDIPSFSLTLSNANGSALARIKDGDEVRIHRGQKPKFVGIVEGHRLDRSNETATFQGRNKFYLTLLKRVCEYYRTFNGTFAPVVNPWEYGRVLDNGVTLDGLRPDEMFRALIGTKFYWQEYFLNEDAFYKKKNWLIQDGLLAYSGSSGSTALLESVPLHNGPDLVNPMGTVRDCKIVLTGTRTKHDPVIKVSRDGGYSWYRALNVAYDGVSWNASTNFSTALSFDGSDRNVTLPSGMLDGATAVTVSALAYIETTSDFGRILDYGWQGVGSIVLMQGVPGAMHFGVADGTATYASIGSSIPVKTWMRVTGRWESGTAPQLMVQGVTATSGTVKSMSLGNHACRIGASNTGGSRWNGRLKDVRIYNRKLTDSEVAIISSSEGVVTEGLVGYWKLDDGDGTVVKDYSGNGLNGTLNGTSNQNIDHTTGDNSDYAIHTVSGVTGRAQSFQVSKPTRLISGAANVLFKMRRVGNPSGTAHIKIGRTLGSADVTASFLASTVPTSNTVFGADLGNMSLEPGVTYYAWVEYSGGDASNHLTLRGFSSDTVPNGVRWFFSGGTWQSASGDYTIRLVLEGRPWVDEEIPGFDTGQASNGYAVKFSGLSTSTVSHRLSLNGNRDAGIAVSCSINPQDPSAGGILFEKVDVWKLTLENGRLHLFVYDNGYKLVGSSTANILPQWHHITVSWRPNTIATFFIDGVYQTDFAPLVLTAAYNYLGTGQFQFGMIPHSLDNLLIFANSLSTDESQMLNLNSAIISRGMALELLFEEGAGSTANDTSFNGNNATLGSGTVWIVSHAKEGSAPPVRNRLAFRIEATDHLVARYLKLDATTDSDTGITEGVIQTYVHPFEDGDSRVTLNMSGQSRITAIEQVRRLTVASDLSVSPNWDAWIDSDGKFHFREIRGDRNLVPDGSFEHHTLNVWSNDQNFTPSSNGLDTTYSAVGRYSLQVSVSDAYPDAGNRYAGKKSTFIELANEPFGDYVLTHKFRRNSGTVLSRVGIMWYNDQTYLGATERNVEPVQDGVWETVTTRGARPANANRCQVFVRGHFSMAGGVGTIHFDDVRLQPAQTPRTYSFDELNLKVIDKRSSSDIVNNLIAKGAGSEPYAITIISDTLKDHESIHKYGLRTGYFIDSNIDDITTLYNRGRAYLKLVAWPRDELEVVVMNDWDCPWEVGDKIRVEDDASLSTGNLRVMSASYSWDGEEQIKLNLTNAAPTFSGVMRDVAKEIRSQKNVPSGALSHSVASGQAIRMGKNQDGVVEAAEHEIVITDPESVNRIFISLKTEAFDTYSTGLESTMVDGISGSVHSGVASAFLSSGGGWVPFATVSGLGDTLFCNLIVNFEPETEGTHTHNIRIWDGTTFYEGSNFRYSSSLAPLSFPAHSLVYPKNANGKTLTLYAFSSANPGKNYNLKYTLSAVGAPTHNHPVVHGIYKFKGDPAGATVIYPANLGLYIGQGNFNAGTTFDDIEPFGSELASIEYRRIDISNATNPDGSFVFRNADGLFRPGTYKVYIKPLSASPNNPNMLGKVVVSSYLDRLHIGQ